jgi:hypothetical protein
MEGKRERRGEEEEEEKEEEEGEIIGVQKGKDHNYLASGTA